MKKNKYTDWVIVFSILIIIQIISPVANSGIVSLLNDTKYQTDVNFYYYNEYNSLNQNYNKDQCNSIILSEEVKTEKISLSKVIPETYSANLLDYEWPMLCFDPRHTSQSPYSTVHIDGLEKWRFKCVFGVDGSPIVGEDGSIYFGDHDWNIYSLYLNGTLKWKYRPNNWITSAPALAKDGTLYVGCWDHYLYALNSTTGIMKWRFNAKGTIAGSLTIADDGTIHFGTMWDSATGHRIWAVNPNGTEKWQYKTGGDITSSPAIGDDGIVYIGSMDNYLYSMNPNGTLKWRFKTGHYVKGPPSIADDGTVYIGSWDDYLYALYPNNGTLKWKCKIGSGTETNPSIASDGTIYVGGDKLWAINPNGTKKWTFDLGEGHWIHQSSPAISADGTIYVGTHFWEVDGGDIIAVNPDGTEKWRKFICDEWIDSSPCIAEDGTVYIGSQCDHGGYLHAFGPVNSNSPPETPTISGDTSGNINEYYVYNIKSIDLDNNPVSFYIDWGDGKKEWTLDRASGEKSYFEHRWNKQGNYTIRVKAKDTLGEESDWATLEVTMPKTKQSTNWWFLQFLEKHPHMFPIIRQLLGLD